MVWVFGKLKVGKINTSQQEVRRKHMYEFVEKHPDWPKNRIAQHFRDEEISKSTIYDVLDRIAKNIPPERIPRASPPHCKMTKDKVKRLKTRIDHRDGISQRGLAQVFNVSQSTISRTIKGKTPIRHYKKQKTPKRTAQQKAVARPKCTRLTSIFRGKKIIIDDESYFGLSNHSLPGNDGFYSSNLDVTPIEVQLKRKEKFPPKLLIWVAFSEKGISKPYIVPSGQAINQDVYINECLNSRLIPFINEHHKNDEVVFWPDLASSHYANKVQDFLKAQKIEYVPKVRNIANVPELRPIEDFWALIKRDVYAKNWQADGLVQLSARIKYCFSKVNQDVIRRLAKGCFTRVDAARRKGIKNL
jgi:transposase